MLFIQLEKKNYLIIYRTLFESGAVRSTQNFPEET
jgi:hypothetical protein